MNSLPETLATSPADLGMDTPMPPKSSDTSMPEPSSHYSPGVSTGIEERALKLLGSGIAAESVAAALGVTAARISQLLSEESFSNQVATLRYTHLQAHNERDSKYDTLEDRLIAKLEKALPLLMKPEAIMNAIKITNGAQRRGQSTPDQVVNTQNIVNIVLPKVIASKFTINVDNQVIKAGTQELHTMPSGNLLKQVEKAEDARVLEHQKETQEMDHVQEDGGTTG
jgi:hypothetical protein